MTEFIYGFIRASEAEHSSIPCTSMPPASYLARPALRSHRRCHAYFLQRTGTCPSPAGSAWRIAGHRLVPPHGSVHKSQQGRAVRPELGAQGKRAARGESCGNSAGVLVLLLEGLEPQNSREPPGLPHSRGTKQAEAVRMQSFYTVFLDAQRDPDPVTSLWADSRREGKGEEPCSPSALIGLEELSLLWGLTEGARGRWTLH